MTFQAKYTPEQRAAAVEMVEQIAQAAGKRRGAIAAAATRLGLHPSIVAYWVSVDDKPAPAQPAMTDAPPVLVRRGLVGLVWCGLCRRLMVPTQTQLGAPALGCPDRCGRRSGVVIAELERIIGGMILERLSVAGRPALNQMTIKSAAEQAPKLLNRIVVGSRPESVRVRWRLAPLPVASSRPGRSGETATAAPADASLRQEACPERVNRPPIPGPRAPSRSARAA